MQIVSLVTGGAGFLGAHVSECLLQMGHQVVIIDNLSGGFIENIPPNAQFIEADVTNSEHIDEIFRQFNFNYVFHLAAYAAEGLSHFIRRFNYQNNLQGSINLTTAAINHNVECFVFASSAAVYGEPTEQSFAENQAVMPVDPYGVAKLAVEHELLAAKDMFDMDFIVFRPHNVYGERQNIGDRYRNVVGIFMNQALMNNPFTIFGDGSQTRAFSYIQDVAPTIARSITIPQARNQIFNIGAERTDSVKDVAVLVAQAFDTPLQIQFLPQRHEVKHISVSHQKLHRIFGKKEETSLGYGITKMAEWAKAHGARSSQPFTQIDIYRKFPDSWLDNVTTPLSTPKVGLSV